MTVNGEPLIVYAGANAPHPRAEDEDVADPLTPAEDQAFPAMSAPTVSSGAAVGRGRRLCPARPSGSGGVMNDDIILDRRRCLAGMVTAVAASQLGMIDFAAGKTAAEQPRATPDGGNRSFGTLKQVDAGVLSVGYAEAGPPLGPVVILLHGWPYDIHSFVDVAPLLASAGHRVIVPHLRGYGTTRFLSSETFRNGQPAALAADVIALMDALKIRQAILGGFDWGARTADIDRKSTRLNSSHGYISYAVFCLKKKKSNLA